MFVLFKSKSFDLINEDELKKHENLYDPKRCRWISFVVIPALIGFSLLLILVNVDFTGTAYVMTTTTTTLVTDATTLQTFTPALTTTLQFESDNNKESIQRNIDSDYHDANAKIAIVTPDCKTLDNNSCKISCTGTVTNVKVNLENQFKVCNGDSLEVILHNCKFPSGQMRVGFFTGYFYVHNLTISNCNLEYIYPNVFIENSVTYKLKTLVLENTQFLVLDDLRFLNLHSLTYFGLRNMHPVNSNFSGLSFLKSLAATLNETKLLQLSTYIAYDPAGWLGFANFEKLLLVDLSNNYFSNILQNTTFTKLVKVQRLILSECAIYAMESGTFDTIMKTLLYLDLRKNQLTQLSGDFLSYSENNLKIEMSSNRWECTCNNNEMIKYIQKSDFDFEEEPKCTSPAEWQGTNVKYVSLQCEVTLSTTTTEPEKTSTTPETTETDIATKTSTVEQPDPSTSPAKTTMDETDSDTSEITETTSKTTQDDKTTLETTQNTGASETTETTETTEAIPKSPDTTTQEPQINEMNILCKDYTKNITFNQTVRNYDALFGVYPESSTSVVLFILNDMSKLRLIYFIPKKYFNSQYTNQSAKVTSRKCERVVTTTIVHIQGLIKNQTYVFCLVPHDEKRISPFNCRSHQLEDPKDYRESWLHINDIAWMVPVIGVGVVICVIFGSFGIFRLLRWRPTWLFGSKRLIRMGCKPHEMLLLPKADRTSSENQYLSGLTDMRPSMSNVLEPERYSAVNSNDYMEFYKNTETSKLKKIAYIPDNFPPSDRAPVIPCCSSRPVSLQSTIGADDLMQQCTMDDFDNDYQSLDHYEHIG